ncbi:MAG TPA: R3H domain-containing nucleic acid-binding protein [bacterium]|jgi:spoIIIJ-associated protein|nr:R3H domain-containing nucleic acid-binding protein [bacterium]
MDFIEKEGLSVPEAVFAAARALGIDEKDAQVQVLSAPGARRVKVRVGLPGAQLPAVGELPRSEATGGGHAPGQPVSERPERVEHYAKPADYAAQAPVRNIPDAGQARRAADDLERLLAAMGTPGAVECKERAGNMVLNVLSSEHENLLIGRRGQTAEALQTLINEFMGRREGDPGLYVVVDVADYHGRQEQRLVEKALALAEQVLADGVQASMGQLSSVERRVVHLTLKSVAGVESFSVGQGSVKKLVIQKKG